MNAQQINLNIPLNFNQLIDIVKQLPMKEKIQLEKYLWDQTDASQIDIPVEQQKIVKKRLQKMNDNPEECLSWDEIERKIKL